MTQSLFRWIIAISVVTGLFGGSFDLLFPAFIPEAAIRALLADEATVSMALVIASVVAGVIILVLLVAAIAGLLMFRRWGRSLAAWTTVLSLGFWPILGVTVQSGWASALMQLSATTWGVALAIAYFSPLAAEFSGQAANNSFKPKPLRGSA